MDEPAGTLRKEYERGQMSDLDGRGRRRRAVVLVLLLVGALTLIASCGAGDDAEDAGPVAQATDVDLSGVDVEMHHAVG